MSYGGEAMFSLTEMILDGGISRCSGYECKMPQLGFPHLIISIAVNGGQYSGGGGVDSWNTR